MYRVAKLALDFLVLTAMAAMLCVVWHFSER
jgi:hypothetical protein